MRQQQLEAELQFRQQELDLLRERHVAAREEAEAKLAAMEQRWEAEADAKLRAASAERRRPQTDVELLASAITRGMEGLADRRVEARLHASPGTGPSAASTGISTKWAKAAVTL